MTIYLSGPIQECPDSECLTWRNYVKTNYHNFTYLDPSQLDYRGHENEHINEIVRINKEQIDNSDIILVNFTRPSTGTAMECMYAFQNHKTIILVTNGRNNISPWLQYHALHIENTVEDAMTTICELAFPGEPRYAI